MTLCIPFFFLLVDSVFVSALAGFLRRGCTTGAMVPPPVPVVACVNAGSRGSRCGRPAAELVRLADSAAVVG